MSKVIDIRSIATPEQWNEIGRESCRERVEISVCAVY